jgi:hypothetical protein
MNLLEQGDARLQSALALLSNFQLAATETEGADQGAQFWSSIRPAGARLGKLRCFVPGWKGR